MLITYPMFRKISYSVMIAAVILSWGIILNIAHSADRENGAPQALLAAANSAGIRSGAAAVKKPALPRAGRIRAGTEKVRAKLKSPKSGR